MKSLTLALAFASWLGLSGSALAQESTTADTDNQTIDTDMIVGGKPAKANKWPWQVRLFDDSNDKWGGCGGSLVAKQWVLTAAHCVVGKNSVQVGYGNNDVLKLTRVKSSEIIYHRGYEPETFAKDIALIKLSKPITFGKGAAAVRLGSRSFYEGLADKKAWVTGWGQLYDWDKLDQKYPDGKVPWSVLVPRKLQEVDVRVQDTAKCSANYGGIPSGHMCAGYDAGGKDSCHGDSGGPLVAREGDRWVQVGIVSFGNGCAKKKFYGVYTRADYFRDWIKDTIARAD